MIANYEVLVQRLRESADWADHFAVLMGRDGDVHAPIMCEAADAIEELLSAVPPKLWTDEPITWTEFMTHTGSVGFEIHFRTPDVEKYKAVQEECRRQIDHAKPQPPKEET